MDAEIVDELLRRVAALEATVVKLERQVDYLDALRYDRSGWQELKLDYDLTQTQTNGICDVLEEAYQLIQQGHPLNSGQLEKRLAPHLSEKAAPGPLRVPYNFIKSLLMLIQDTGQWPGLPDHYRRDFNVPTKAFLEGRSEPPETDRPKEKPIPKIPLKSPLITRPMKSPFNSPPKGKRKPKE
jgi:hypothetical protein